MKRVVASFRNRNGRGGIATGLAVALVLMLTPCCEIFAALHAGGTAAGEAHSHSTSGDQHSPLPSGENCAPWFEQAFVPANDAASPPVSRIGVDDLAWPAAWPVAQSRPGNVAPHAGAPPLRPRYLLTQRFLL